MGVCFSCIRNGAPSGPKEGGIPFPITVVFPGYSAFSFHVRSHETVASIRKRAIAEMEHREQQGDPFTQIKGTLVTVNDHTGENSILADSLTVWKARLAPKQYLWFQDEDEDARIAALMMRSSRLTENTSYNSRGVKHGMDHINNEDQPIKGF